MNKDNFIKANVLNEDSLKRVKGGAYEFYIKLELAKPVPAIIFNRVILPLR